MTVGGGQEGPSGGRQRARQCGPPARVWTPGTLCPCNTVPPEHCSGGTVLQGHSVPGAQCSGGGGDEVLPPGLWTVIPPSLLDLGGGGRGAIMALCRPRPQMCRVCSATGVVGKGSAGLRITE